MSRLRVNLIPGKLPVLNLLSGQNQVFRPVLATRCTDSGQILQSRLTPEFALHCKISPQSAQGVGNSAPKCQKFPLFDKVSFRKGELFDRFLELLPTPTPTIFPNVIRPFICASVF